MPLAVAGPVRAELARRRLAGEPLVAIAAGLGLSYRTARGLWRRYRERGAAGLGPDYGRCGRRGPRCAAEVHEAALALRRAHPGWGAGLLRVELAGRCPGRPLPSRRTLNRWLRAAGLQPPRGRAPAGRVGRGRAAHAVWELDAKERLRLGDGSPASLLSAVDEASGAAVGAVPFPPLALEHGGPAGGPGGAARAVRALGPAGAGAGG